MTITDAVILANPITCELGEGPVWDPIREAVLWVDIRRGLVFSGRLDAHGRISDVEHVPFPGTVGAVAVAEDGSWIVAAAKTLLVHPATGSTRGLARVIPGGEPRRTNDGKPDPAGRFLIGTLSLGDDSQNEVLVRLERDGSLTTIDDDLTLSNGLAWSPDGSVLYSVDTLRRVVFARSYDMVTGATGERRALIEFAEGFPDGMCSDEDGHLWIAMWGLGEVRRYTPDGEHQRTIRVPAPHVSSVAFAGPDPETLVITTATQDLTDEQLAAYPLSGKLFSTQPGVRGLPVPLWSGVPEKQKETP
ncbi:SMP-30/gluconolactonase/LRE family protein [Microbacterium yannicii]|uniref:SMP-30/gluconolactonase/LRE family protein n=1 Tax=Microbacterium yannicii TaxID=671622 RepID=UPI00058CDB27|nr:SMP-30/gluconolactonase/LRE family protein [Microbacterium yannicii]